MYMAGALRSVLRFILFSRTSHFVYANYGTSLDVKTYLAKQVANADSDATQLVDLNR